MSIPVGIEKTGHPPDMLHNFKFFKKRNKFNMFCVHFRLQKKSKSNKGGSKCSHPYYNLLNTVNREAFIN